MKYRLSIIRWHVWAQSLSIVDMRSSILWFNGRKVQMIQRWIRQVTIDWYGISPKNVSPALARSIPDSGREEKSNTLVQWKEWTSETKVNKTGVCWIIQVVSPSHGNVLRTILQHWLNKVFCLKFRKCYRGWSQTPEKGRKIQRPKRCDVLKHDESDDTRSIW